MTKPFRECDQCHRKMAPGVARTPRDGKLLCGGCKNGREGRPLTGSKESQWKKAEAPFANIDGHIVRIAHQSGDGETIYHCPFCFSGDSQYLSYNGVQTFAETVGTTQLVLTADDNDRTGGRWAEAHIHEFGEQPLMEVTLQRNQQTKVISSTPEHMWLVKENLKRREDDGISNISRKGKPRDWRSPVCKRGHDLSSARIKSNGTQDCYECAKLAKAPGGSSRLTNREVATQDLRPGHRLSFLRQEGAGLLEPRSDGIRHGVVFGDGTATGKSANVTLWGEKDKQLLAYFPDRKYKETQTPIGINAQGVRGTGVKGVRVAGDLFSWMKGLPDIDSDPEYLYGFLAGYFAADGCVSDQGNPALNCARKEHLEAVRDIATRLGIATYGITMQMREGFPGRDPSAIYELMFLRSTLNAAFFLIEDHRNRFVFNDYEYERFGWVVKSVEMTDRVEPVYCAVVPDTHSFALADNIWVKNCGSGQVIARSDGTTACDFCDTTFIVQIQPQQHAMPQTINGQPFQIPGMPPPSDPSTDPAQPDPNEATESDHESFGGDDLSEKVDDKEEDSLKDLNKGAMFITTNGMALPLADFEEHMALAHTGNREKTLEEVKRNRRD